MRRLHMLAATLVLVPVAALVLAGCDGGPSTSTTVTRARIERSLERAFPNRYVALSKINGHDDVTVESLDAHAVCDKGGPTVADEGPGGDWNCQIAYVDPHVPNPDGSAKIELNVHSNGCYTAGGSPKAVGQLNIVDTKGRPVVNPAFEFDACFDPSSPRDPDGTMLIVTPPSVPGAPQFDSALTLPVGLVEPDAKGRVPLTLMCAEGGEDCTGTIAITLQGTSVPSVSYDVPAGATKVVDATPSKAQVQDGGIFNLVADEQTPKPVPKEP